MMWFGQFDELATASQTQNGTFERQHEQLYARSAGEAENVHERSRPTGNHKVRHKQMDSHHTNTFEEPLEEDEICNSRHLEKFTREHAQIPVLIHYNIRTNIRTKTY